MEKSNKTESISIIGFIFAFLMPLVGLILSIIGLSKAKKNNSQQGLSIAGLIISLVALLFRLLIIGGATLAYFSASDLKDYAEDKLDSMCSKVTSCDKGIEDYYNCYYKEGIIDYSVTCKKEQIPDGILKDKKKKTDDKEYTLEEIEQLAVNYYNKSCNCLYAKSDVKELTNLKVEIDIYSSVDDTIPSTIYTIDRNTLVGKDNNDKYIDLNDKSDELLEIN